MGKYSRIALNVEAIKYEPSLAIEDGFELWSKVVTNGWVVTEGLVKITRPDGSIVCPFIQNRRGVIFIRENDYIISEDGGERHVCGSDKFHLRYQPRD